MSSHMAALSSMAHFEAHLFYFIYIAEDLFC